MLYGWRHRSLPPLEKAIMSEIFKSLSWAIGKVRVKSVVDNLIRLILILVLFIIVAACLKVADWLLIVFVAIMVLSFALMGFAYLYFAKHNPDYLRSEDYHLRKQSIEMLGDKDNYLPIDAKEIRGIANPYQDTKAIEVKEDSDE